MCPLVLKDGRPPASPRMHWASCLPKSLPGHCNIAVCGSPAAFVVEGHGVKLSSQPCFHQLIQSQHTQHRYPQSLHWSLIKAATSTQHPVGGLPAPPASSSVCTGSKQNTRVNLLLMASRYWCDWRHRQDSLSWGKMFYVLTVSVHQQTLTNVPIA